jgi:ribosomal protein L11 methyltransferase
MSYKEWLGETFHSCEHGQFRIIPPWEALPDKKCHGGAMCAILLDPGLVFGTGTHPTTRDCLAALELAANTHKLGTVLDLGTGTGLLALAAAKLGSSGVVAVDLNLLAAQTAARNIKLNGLQNRVITVQSRAENMVACPADLVIANIHYDVMQRLIKDKGFLAKKRFILSGLLRRDAKEIAGILARQPVTIIKQWTHEGIWHTIYGKIEQGAE